MKKYDFTYEEEIFDTLGANIMGIITDKDGKERPYFFHALMENDDDEIETCFVYSSISDLMENTNPIARYAWTADNDSMLLMYLNSDLDIERLMEFPFELVHTELSTEDIEEKFKTINL